MKPLHLPSAPRIRRIRHAAIAVGLVALPSCTVSTLPENARPAIDATSDSGTSQQLGDGGSAQPPPIDGGTSSASPSPSDAGAPDAASSSACPGLFCEDFETGALDAKIWSRQELSVGNSVTVQSAKVAHGAFAARFHAKGGTNNALIVNESLPAPLQHHYFGRMSFFATAFPTESGGHTAYVWSSNSMAKFPYSDHHLEVGSYMSQGKPTWQLTYWTGDGPEYPAAGGQIPQGTWACVEWEFNDAPDQAAVWVDGNASPKGFEFRTINGGTTGLLGKLATLGVGFRTFHPTGAPDIDLYVDDIVLDSKRVGCLP